jgi:tetratricopeptide (TPR) repeat protein
VSDFPLSMMRKTRTAWLLLFAVLLACVLPVVPQDTKPSTSTQKETAGPLKEAEGYYRKGSFDQAVAKYNEVLKLDPHSAEAYSGIARCYLKQDKVRDTAEILQRGLQAKPPDPDFKVAQAELLFRQGKIPEAEKILVDVINSRVPNAHAYLDLAELSVAVAMNRRARRLIGLAHELDPDDPDVQKLWIDTLSRAERIKFLEAYLAQQTYDDAHTHQALQENLEFLKAKQATGHGSCRLASEISSAETDLLPLLSDPRHLRGLGLPVILNGQKSKLRLDTGAGGIVINRKLATRAGIPKAAGLHVRGVGDKGDVRAYIGFADSVRIGNLEFRDCPVEVADRGSIGEEEGLIGADVFASFLIEIDFPNRKFKLSELPLAPGELRQKPGLETDSDEPTPAASNDPNAGKGSPDSRFRDRYIAPEMQSYARVYRFGHMLLVPTKMNNIPGRLFLIDSGAFNNTIAPDAAREVAKVSEDPSMRVRGVSGEVKKVYETGDIVLEFGSVRQEQKEMVAFDFSGLSRDVGVEVSGTLGFAMLNILKVKLDYRDALAHFEYIPDPRARF